MVFDAVHEASYLRGLSRYGPEQRLRERGYADIFQLLSGRYISDCSLLDVTFVLHVIYHQGLMYGVYNLFNYNAADNNSSVLFQHVCPCFPLLGSRFLSLFIGSLVPVRLLVSNNGARTKVLAVQRHTSTVTALTS